MVGGMPGGRHRFQRPAGTFDGVAVLDLDIRPEIAVGTGFRIVLLALEARPRGAVRPLGIDRRAGRSLDPRGVRRVVVVGMGDQDMGHGLAAHGIQQRFRMRFVVRPRIDDRDLAAADDVTDRAGEGERARIVAENAPHAGADLVDDSGLKREIAVERDVVVIGHGDYSVQGTVILRCEHLRASKDGGHRGWSSFEARRRGAHLRMTVGESYENA